MNISIIALTQALLASIKSPIRVTGLDDDSVNLTVAGGFLDGRRLIVIRSGMRLSVEFRDDEGYHYHDMPEACLYGFLQTLSKTGLINQALRENHALQCASLV